MALRRTCTVSLAALLTYGATGFGPPALPFHTPVFASGRRPSRNARPASLETSLLRNRDAKRTGPRLAAKPTTSAASEKSTSTSSHEAATETAMTTEVAAKGSNPDVAASLTALGAVLAVAGIFDLGIYYFKGFGAALDFVAGFLVEESLSVDNLFVFLLLFDYFKVPVQYQPRVLQYGILGAVVLRGAFIGAGAVAIQQFRAVLLLFAAILLVSSGKLLVEFFSGGGDDDDEDLSNNSVVKLASSLVDATDKYDEDKFFTEVPDSTNPAQLVKRATPLLLVLVCVELSDIVFAVDSVPAVFGVTEDPLIVFSSNLFAILGLRSIYNLLSEAVESLPYLEPAVAVVLGFVGTKLGLSFFGFEISNAVSLGTIVTLLGAGIGASKILPPPGDDDGDEND